MDFEKPFNKKHLSENARLRHEYVLGTTGKGFGAIGISTETMAGLVDGGVRFIKGDKDIVLTKEELFNEFKICLDTGYFKKEDFFK